MDENEARSAQPLPKMEGLTQQFYGWCRERELRFQRCSHCGTWRHPPRELCAECRSFDWDWARADGTGSVFTYTIVARALHPAFAGRTPYAAVVVELAEGVRLLSRVVNCPPADLQIGLPVEVDFEPVTDTITLPVFRLRSTAG